MNPFSNWKLGDVHSHNERVRTKTRPGASPDKSPCSNSEASTPLKGVRSGKRIRQGEPKIRPWEQEWIERLESDGIWQNIKAQSIRFRLASGAWYKPDVSATLNGRLYCYEIKGGKEMKGVAKGVLALKVAASLYPEIDWILCWKKNGEWITQIVL